MASTSSETPPSSPSETPTINNSTESKPLENADPKGKKPLENNHYNAASSSEITNEDDNHGGALSLSSEMIHKDLRLLDSAQPSLSKSMGVSTSSEAPPSSPTKTPTINKSSTKTKSKGSIWSFVANLANLAKFFVTKPKPLEKNPHNEASSSGITNEDDNHGGALFHSSEMIQKDLLLLEVALTTKYMHLTNEKINQAREKFKELLKLRSSGTDHFDEVRRAIKKLEDQIPSLENNHHKAASGSGTTNEDDNHGGAPSSETDHFDEVRRAIRKLEDQIPLLENNRHNAASSSGTTNKDDNHGGALSHSSVMIQKDLLLLDLALMEYMHHTNEKINQASKDFEGPRLKSSSSETDHFDKVRKAITKLKGQIPLHRSSDSKSQHKEWPNINGAEEGMTHFLYKEPEDEQTGDMGGQRDEAFRALSEPLRCCLLCFFKFPRKEFIRITTMIYLWIGQGYVSLHLKNREGSPQEREEELPLEENAGKKIFDELIAKNFIERCSSVPNSCRMRLSVRSSLYKEAESKAFTSNGALDLVDREFDCGGLDGHLCLINVGEAIINNKLKFFEKMKNIRSLHLGRWQNSAKHHIELEDIKFVDGVLEKLESLTFLSLRGISLIKELPESILKLNDLKILDLRACQNLEVIPKNISLLKNLTHLDMSECYFLEHMPESLALLSNLEVLKGFFIGHVKNKKQSCTLNDLSKLPKLRKLNIYTSVKEFPTSSDLGALQKFEGLLKLTISWGGCSSKDGKNDGMTTDSGAEGQTLHLTLQKLDLQGFPMKNLPHWLRPANLKELKKLYIRGGNLCDLGQLQERPGEKWKVEILRLKYLSELKIDEDKLRSLFPELIYLHQVKSRDDKSGVSDVWMDEEALDTRFWLQKFFKTDGSLSSLERYGPNLAQG